ncbi:MAG: 23S rRNA (guanosine(2251)-2'-O)-methyltransferase RlmB [Candidatus Nanopelagicales bacterium]|nr:23S rRNA (guanosine(2251)-2'-O)-methyltransferase RlmB [Candidatus Nanopelagicales bacterium]MDZ4249025.1 23S rRNA (guanosine(2251)-2'-O)-methyltransferase RlmB [Candidatus Nanopelagicales bacterium]
MAGNSSRRGAVRGARSAKGAAVGSGGRGKRALSGKGPTPPAVNRPGHPAAAKARRKRADRSPGPVRAMRQEVILGRNAVDEALAAGIPAVELAVLDSAVEDVRIRRAKRAAEQGGIPLSLRTRPELDRLADGLPHQGIALLVAPFAYADLADLRRAAGDPAAGRSVVVVLDHIQDPRNLGAIARSAAAFGVDGIVIPERRAAAVTAAAWRASAGALARVPVARVVNVARALSALQKDGYVAVGLSASDGVPIESLDSRLLEQPVALVVGSESSGISRLVAERCDAVATIGIHEQTESLNASAATSIALYLLTQGR